MCVLLITRLLRGVGRWARKPVNHTSWVAVVTPTDRPKSVRNCCLIELFCGVVCVATLSLWHFCWYRGFCHRTGSDLLLFVSKASGHFHAWVHLYVFCQAARNSKQVGIHNEIYPCLLEDWKPQPSDLESYNFTGFAFLIAQHSIINQLRWPIT